MLAPLDKDDSALESLTNRRSARHFEANPCSNLYERKIRGMVSLIVCVMHLFIFICFKALLMEGLI